MQNLPPLTPSQLAEFDLKTGYETPMRPDLAPVRRVIGGTLMTALAVGVGAPLLSATPAYAQDAPAQTYSKSTEDAAHEISVSALPNGARADFVGVDCTRLEDVVGREAALRGLDVSVGCADGMGSATLYGDAEAAQSALTEAATEVLDQPSQTLTAAEVAAEQAMVDAVISRIVVQTPGNTTNPTATVCAPGRGDSVICASQISEHTRTCEPFSVMSPAIFLYQIERVPTLVDGVYGNGVRLSAIAGSSDIIDPVAKPSYRIQILLDNSANVLLIDNTTTGPKSDMRLAQADWANALKSIDAHKLNGRDHLTFDNLLAYVYANTVGVNVDSSLSTCYDTIVGLTREQAVETYLGRLTCTTMNANCGTGLIKYTSAYDATGALTSTSRFDLLTTDPRWSFAREMIIFSKRPAPSGTPWFPDDSGSTLLFRQEGNNLSDYVQYGLIFTPPLSETHLRP